MGGPRTRLSKGTVWFTGDLLGNIQRLPKPPLRWLFTWTDSAPGPSIVIPAHGPPLETSELAVLARAQLERL